MARIKLTSKRQATLPVALCKELGVGPGDELVVERLTADGRPVWVLRGTRENLDWVGSLGPKAKNRSHDWKRIRKTIDRAWAHDDRP